MGMLTLMLFGSLFVLLMASVPIGVAIGSAVLLTMATLDLPPIFFTPKLFNALDTFPLMAVPFFILAGEIMQRGSMSKSLLDVSRCLVGHVTGGLAHISILTCLFYGALSGSAPATTAAVGGIMIPAMEKDGYPREFATAVNTAGGCLGVMIPPSVPLILFGSASGVSISDLFIAGILPGFVVAFGMMVVCYWSARRYNYGTPKPRATFGEFLGALREAKYALMVPVIVLGGIYGGMTTPTEAGVIAVVWALVAEGLILRTLDWAKIWSAFSATAKTTAVIFLIVATATTLGHILMYYNVPDAMLNALTSITQDRYAITAILLMFFLVLGTFMDTGATILILTPMIMPVILKCGINPIHFGITMIVALAIGFLTPPVGCNLFVGCGISKVSIEKLSYAVLPFVFSMVASMLLVAYIPALSLLLLR